MERPIDAGICAPTWKTTNAIQLHPPRRLPKTTLDNPGFEESDSKPIRVGALIEHPFRHRLK